MRFDVSQFAALFGRVEKATLATHFTLIHHGSFFKYYVAGHALLSPASPSSRPVSLRAFEKKHSLIGVIEMAFATAVIACHDHD
jgi:hypothetical protein